MVQSHLSHVTQVLQLPSFLRQPFLTSTVLLACVCTYVSLWSVFPHDSAALQDSIWSMQAQSPIWAHVHAYARVHRAGHCSPIQGCPGSCICQLCSSARAHMQGSLYGPRTAVAIYIWQHIWPTLRKAGGKL